MLWKYPAFFPFKASAVRPVQISGGQLNSAKAIFSVYGQIKRYATSYSVESTSIQITIDRTFVQSVSTLNKG